MTVPVAAAPNFLGQLNQGIEQLQPILTGATSFATSRSLVLAVQTIAEDALSNREVKMDGDSWKNKVKKIIPSLVKGIERRGQFIGLLFHALLDFKISLIKAVVTLPLRFLGISVNNTRAWYHSGIAAGVVAVSLVGVVAPGLVSGLPARIGKMAGEAALNEVRAR